MSGPDDKIPPHERGTLTELPPNDTDRPPSSADFGTPEFFQLSLTEDADRPPLAIPAGHAQHAFAVALDDMQRAFALVEATGMALARQLDSQAHQEAP